MDGILPDDIRELVLREITPPPKELEHQQKIIKTLTQALTTYSESNGFEFSFIEPQGSTGKKQTQLKGAGDIDLFVALDPMEHEETLALPVKEKNKELDIKLDSLVDDWFIPAFGEIETSDMLKTYSQHPYLSLKYLGCEVDVLVCFDLTKEKLASSGPFTAVDRTVHHSQFVAERIDTSLREDIRILKSFVRASHTYGDICPVGQMGFTGYSLELLVILQNGFSNALQAIRDLQQSPIDVKGRSLETLQDIPAFRDNHIFIVDPTDTNRNVASSFSKRSYDWLRLMTTRLLNTSKGNENSYRNLLIEQPLSIEPIPDWLEPHSFAFTYDSDSKYHYTILRDKLFRHARKISSQLQNERTGETRFGKVLFEVLFDDKQFAVGFLLEKIDITEVYSRKGPPIGIEGSKRFSESHERVYEQDGHLWVEEKRKWTNAGDMLENIIGKHNIKGLTLEVSPTELDVKVQNVLYRYVLPVEPEFPVKGTV